MKVILNKDIPSLGEEGDIKDVARGYARNYLIPNKLVMPYTREALSILESRREQLVQRKEEKRKAALDIKTRLETEVLTLEMPAGERGRLFGSVTSANIVDLLAAKGISVERKRIEIPEKTIKSVGTVRVHVRLYGDEEAELKVVVTAAGGKGDAVQAAAAAPAEKDTAEAATESGDMAEATDGDETGFWDEPAGDDADAAFADESDEDDASDDDFDDEEELE